MQLTGYVGPVERRASAQLLVGLFEPSPQHVLYLRDALSGIDHHLVPLGDPALSVRDWIHTPFDIVIANPFSSVGRVDEVCRLCRRLAAGRPFFAVTAQDEAIQRTVAIASGADDALGLNGAAQELATRIIALVRRDRITRGHLACDDLQIDLIRRAVSRAGRNISLPLREFDLLATLAETPDEVVPRTHLLRSVWKLDFDPGTNRVEVHMSRLRRRIDRGEHFAMLRTVKGVGYALVSRAGAPIALSAAAAVRAG